MQLTHLPVTLLKCSLPKQQALYHMSSIDNWIMSEISVLILGFAGWSEHFHQIICPKRSSYSHLTMNNWLFVAVVIEKLLYFSLNYQL
ncbi:MAG: hypothetical protein QNJ60_18470 [Xenococcaceae cyanobacterium MO_188.B19]|nr:hypothetical protein [Xenococcaceae cyanobacterium MO_188.B19]